MNRDDIIRMAREASGEEAWSGGVEWTWEELERFAALIATAEREACAKLCHDKAWDVKGEALKEKSRAKGLQLNAAAIAWYDAHEAIRARGQE